jgi:hypothetical protein
MISLRTNSDLPKLEYIIAKTHYDDYARESPIITEGENNFDWPVVKYLYKFLKFHLR